MVLWIVLAAGFWLIGLGFFMLIAPGKALAALSRMGGSQAIHFGEMTVRILVGVAMIMTAHGSRHPVAFAVIGAFLIASAVLLLVLPRRWHSAYSKWWAARIPVAAVRVVAPFSWIMGGMLIWAAL